MNGLNYITYKFNIETHNAYRAGSTYFYYTHYYISFVNIDFLYCENGCRILNKRCSLFLLLMDKDSHEKLSYFLEYLPKRSYFIVKVNLRELMK